VRSRWQIKQTNSYRESSSRIAAAICGGKAGTMTRDAEMFLASVCAEFLVERMALAGLVVVRRAPYTDPDRQSKA